MKLFLKPFAVFACVALLFCACSDDGTKDVAGTTTATSEFKGLQPGEERAWAKWIVPTDEAIANCELSWVSDDGETVGSQTWSATSGVMEALLGENLELSSEYSANADRTTVYTSMPSGNYTFKVKNLNSAGVAMSETITNTYVYDQDTYESRANPRPIPSTMFYDDDNGAQIWWSNIPDDCIGVTMYYEPENSFNSASVYFDIVSEDIPIIITDAVPNEQFTYTSHFRPNVDDENNCGLDIIDIADDQTQYYMFPSSAPSAPFGVTVLPGDSRFKVQWSVPLVADITGTCIEYSNGVDVIKQEIKGDDLKKGVSNVNTAYCNNLAPGVYDVKVYNVKITGTTSEVQTEQITVYDKTTYTGSAKIRQEISMVSVGSEQRAEISWDYSDIDEAQFADCVGVVAQEASTGNYSQDGNTDDERAENLLEANTDTDESIAVNTWSYIDGAAYSGDVSYITYYRPADGLDFIGVETTDDNLNTIASSLSPDKPYNVTFRPGDYSIFFEFDITTDQTISKLVIEYVNSQDNTNYGRVEVAKSNLEFGSDNFTLISTMSSIIDSSDILGLGSGGTLPKVGQTYDLYMWTETSAGVKSAYELGEGILMYDYDVFKSTCSLPTMAYNFDIDYPYGATITWGNTDICNYLDLTYVSDVSGTESKYRVTSFDNPCAIESIMPGNKYSYKAYFEPAANAMDVYSMEMSTGEFPTLSVDRSQIKSISFYGDAVIDVSGVASEGRGTDYISFDALFDDLYSLSTSTTVSYSSGAVSASYFDSMIRYQTEPDQKDKTLSYDLGATYKLTEFYYAPYLGHVASGFTDAQLSTNYTITRFSLYGTATSDPQNKTALNRVDDDGIPILTDWITLLDNVTVPDLNLGTYAGSMDYDYDGNSVVNTDDMQYAIQYMGGFPFAIPDDKAAVRYLRLQFHEAANESLVEGVDTYVDNQNAFLIIELNHKHMGYE